MSRAAVVVFCLPALFISGCGLFGGDGSSSSMKAINNAEDFREIAQLLQQLEDEPEKLTVENIAKIKQYALDLADEKESEVILSKIEVIEKGAAAVGGPWGYIIAGVLGIGGYFWAKSNNAKRPTLS